MKRATAEELPMKSSDFDRIMRRALEVQPEPAPKAKTAKPKKSRKKAPKAK